MRLLITRLLVLCSLTSFVAFGAAMYTFTGEQAPSVNNQGPSNFQGVNCDPTNATCVPGTPSFIISSATLVQSAMDPNSWTLTVVTNDPTGGSDGFSALAFGDALFQYGTDSQLQPIYWGLALGSQTVTGSETPGGLYEENLFNGKVQSDYPDVYLTAGQAGYSGGRTNEPVWINTANMSLASTSSSLSVTCYDGTSFVAVPASACNSQYNGYDLYTITDTFEAPSGFLSSGVFSFEVASYVCANGLIIANETPVPEPRWAFLLVPALLLLFGRRLKQSRSAVQQ
jgi:hypothetical protein